MTDQKSGFWRGFTWKRFAKYSISIFLVYFIVSLVVDLFDPEAFLRDNFTLKSLGRNMIRATTFGFICAVWFEPANNDGAMNKKKPT